MSITLNFCEDNVSIESMREAVSGHLTWVSIADSLDPYWELSWQDQKSIAPLAVRLRSNGKCIYVDQPDLEGYNNGQSALEEALGIECTYAD